MNIIFEYLFFLPVIFIHLYISCSLTWNIWPEEDLNDFYDYIVVGAGSSGVVVATRLAQIKPENGVLLVEAGPKPSNWLPFDDIPILGPLFFGSSYDWNYLTVPQRDACLAMNQQSCTIPAGRVIGGSSRINNMIYLRGHPKDVRPQFGDITEAEWFNYLLKAEKQTGFYSSDNDYHSTSGPWDVSDLPWASRLAKGFLQAGAALGYPVRDLNGPNSTGFMQVQMNIRNGARLSIDRAYLPSAPSEYIRVISNSLVTRVILTPNQRASAVSLKYHGCQKTIYARKGIILAAGTFGTPKLLMLSGIGPREHLENHGISVRVDSPNVGSNLQDHILTGLDLVLLNSSWLISPWDVAAPFAGLHYFLSGRGPWTSPGCEAVALLSDDDINQSAGQDSHKDPPAIQLSAVNSGLTVDYGAALRHNLGIKDHIWNEYYLSRLLNADLATASVAVTLLQPQSRGTVRLASTDPSQSPLIDPKYLSYPNDIKKLLRGLMIVYELLETEPMKEIGAYFNRQIFPGCREYLNSWEKEAPIPDIANASSKAYWICYIQHLSFSHFHPIGTAALGTVLDKNFAVRGVSGLFVVDASAIPILPSANIHAAVVARAEIAAQKIFQLHQQSQNYCLNEKRKRLLLERQITCPCPYFE